MRNTLLISLFLLLSLSVAAADNIQQQDVQTALPQNISYSNCYKIYSINKENLFYLTIEALNENKYTINEIQTNNGYLLFTADKKRYLASISGIDKNNSILKITPYNNLYYFRKDIISNIMGYVELNKDNDIK